jgi:lysophospholipase L1-like esterase
MKLEGLKVNFLGDSITQGHGTSAPDKIFHAILAKKYGFEARNYGVGGSRIAKQKNEFFFTEDGTEYSERYKTMKDDADLVVVFGGTNDFGHGDAMMGSFADRTNDTFYGACHTLFEGAINKYPNATIVIMTPLHRHNEDCVCGSGDKQVNLAPLSAYVQIIREVAEYYSLPVLDLWSVSGIQPRVEIIKQKYCPDGLHPNDAGHALIAARLKGFLEAL